MCFSKTHKFSIFCLYGNCREVAQPGRALELANMLSWWRSCRGLPMVGFILACLGHRYRAVAGSNPALPTIQFLQSNYALTRFLQAHTKYRCKNSSLATQKAATNPKNPSAQTQPCPKLPMPALFLLCVEAKTACEPRCFK